MRTLLAILVCFAVVQTVSFQARSDNPKTLPKLETFIWSSIVDPNLEAQAIPKLFHLRPDFLYDQPYVLQSPFGN